MGPGIWPPPRAGKRVYLFHPFDSALGKGNGGCCNLYRLNRNNYWRVRIFGGGFYTRLFQVQVILALPIVRVVSNLNLSLLNAKSKSYFYTIFVFGSLLRLATPISPSNSKCLPQFPTDVSNNGMVDEETCSASDSLFQVIIIADRGTPAVWCL